jgi:hypothetical protein
MKKLFLLTIAFALVSTVTFAEEAKTVLTDANGRLTDEQLLEWAKEDCTAGRQVDWPKLTAEGWAQVRECITKAKEQRILKDPQVAEICGIHSNGMALTECAYNVYKNKNVEKWKLAKAQHEYIELLKKRLAESEKTQGAGTPTKSHNELREKLKRALAEQGRTVRDPRIAKACEKYTGGQRIECVHWNYTKGSGAASYSPLRYKFEYSQRLYPGEDPTHPEFNTPQHTPGGVTGGRTTSPRGGQGSNSDKSTITGTIGEHSGSAESGGPTQKIHRPAFLGGGSGGDSSRAATGGVGASAPARHNPVGGVRVGGATTTSESVDLSSLKDAVMNQLTDTNRLTDTAKPKCGDPSFIGPCQPKNSDR